MIVIVDNGMGNIKSVENASVFLGKKVKVSSSPSDIKKAKKIIFPGVGHFEKAMLELKRRRILNVLKGTIKDGVPFLGICLGMQLLLDKSQEASGIKGLGVIKGEVKKFKLKGLIVPHMGWNQISFNKIEDNTEEDTLLNKVKNDSFFYFAHSYYCVPEDKRIITTITNYGIDFVSSFRSKNVWAVQFHPEKSQKLGLKVFNNFLNLA